MYLSCHSPRIIQRRDGSPWNLEERCIAHASPGGVTDVHLAKDIWSSDSCKTLYAQGTTSGNAKVLELQNGIALPRRFSLSRRKGNRSRPGTFLLLSYHCRSTLSLAKSQTSAPSFPVANPGCVSCITECMQQMLRQARFAPPKERTPSGRRRRRSLGHADHQAASVSRVHRPK